MYDQVHKLGKILGSFRHAFVPTTIIILAWKIQAGLQKNAQARIIGFSDVVVASKVDHVINMEHQLNVGTVRVVLHKVSTVDGRLKEALRE